MDLISVIVPVYKVEAYLDKCVQSIVDQTYEKLEIILVDDGSPDACGSMCDAWEQMDSRIRVIHKENGGLSDARNAGMAVATGEYIAFVDSDDWIDLCYLERMYGALKEHGAQMAACGVKFVYEGEVFEKQVPINAVAMTAEEALGTVIRGEGVRAVAWNKLYHRELLQGETFPVGKYHEDEFFTYRIIAKAQIIVFVPNELYFYLQRGSGIMGTVSVKHLDALDAYWERLHFLEKEYPRLYAIEKITFCNMCVGFYKMALAFSIGAEERKLHLKRIRFYRKQVKVSFAEWKSCSLRDKIFVWGSKVSMHGFCKLLDIKEK